MVKKESVSSVFKGINMQSTMRKIVFSEMSFWVILAGVCVYALYPLRSSLRYGVDLVGGVYLTLEVQVDKAVESSLATVMSSAYKSLKTQGKIPLSK
jgi:preprotein translocase subunit SecD